MIIAYNKENLKRNIDTELKLLNTNISNYQVKSKILSRHMPSTNDYNSYSLYNFEDYSLKLNSYIDSMNYLKDLLNELLVICNENINNEFIDEKLKYYNEEYNKIESENFSFLLRLNTFVYSYIKSSKSNLATSNYQITSELKKDKNIEIVDDKKEQTQDLETPIQDTNTNIQNQEQETPIQDTNNDIQIPITDNKTLIISEIQNKVFLPYTIAELEKILNENDKYNNINEIVSDLYIIPIDKYKFSNKSRFKETYDLMRKKEKASIVESLNIALEQTFNSSLNPAIIAACKNLDQLDIYLDCLDTNETNKFPFFEIKYEMLPSKK